MKRKYTIIVCLVAVLFLLTACGGKKTKDLLVGKWVSEDNEVLEFGKDGSCIAPFTYNASWVESAERYTIKDDGTLLLSSRDGHADCSFEQAESKEKALDNGSTYYISKGTLIIRGDEYEQTE